MKFIRLAIGNKLGRGWRLTIVFALPLLVAACTGNSSSDSLSQSHKENNRPPIIKAAKILLADQELRVEIDAEDPDHDTINFDFQWYANGAPLPGQISALLSASVAKRDAQVAVEITPRDGSLKGQVYRTASISLGNTPPHVTAITLTPSVPKPGDQMEVRIDASDRDLDRVDASYQWFKNNTLVKESEEPFFVVTGFVPGDTIAVEVSVRDSISQGNSLRSEQIMIGNSLPRIISVPPTAPVMPDRYEYLVKANDSDGDQLTYYLESSPQGMTIGEKSGLIEWPISTNVLGSFHVKIIVRDNHGGSALQEFNLVLSASPPSMSNNTGV